MAELRARARGLGQRLGRAQHVPYLAMVLALVVADLICRMPAPTDDIGRGIQSVYLATLVVNVTAMGMAIARDLAEGRG